MKRNQIILLACVTGVLFIAASLLLYRMENRRQLLPIHYQVKDFSLTDSNGEAFDQSRLTGKVWVAAFVFSTCGDVCPRMSKNLASLHRSYALTDDVAFVSVTVNPEYDDPKVLREYAQKYQADTRKWHFLTGPRENITELMINSFKMGSMEEPIFHSTNFVLVDRKGYIRGYYDGMKQDDVNRLFKDIAALLKERPR